MIGMQAAAKLRRTSQLCALIALLLGGPSPAMAGELMPELNTCTAPDCGATVIRGFVNGFTQTGFPNVAPWVVQIFAARNECLRLRVIEQATDTELIVVAASLKAYRNDNGKVAPCPKCPLVKLRTGGVGGWHTVQVNQAEGAVVGSAFKLSFGRYNKDNPNCSPPTKPVP
jgi:hypothetical protein